MVTSIQKVLHKCWMNEGMEKQADWPLRPQFLVVITKQTHGLQQIITSPAHFPVCTHTRP